MKEALELIDQIIEEHKHITQEGRNIKQVSSDYEVGLKLGDAKEGSEAVSAKSTRVTGDN